MKVHIYMAKNEYLYGVDGIDYDYMIKNKLEIIKYELINGNGKVIEFDDLDDVFKGEYLNGKRNGKGREFDGLVNEIIFEGEYLNGFRHGYGKEYYANCKTEPIFEGEYLKGLRWNGKGKEYSGMNNIKIMVEYKNGEKIKF